MPFFTVRTLSQVTSAPATLAPPLCYTVNRLRNSWPARAVLSTEADFAEQIRVSVLWLRMRVAGATQLGGAGGQTDTPIVTEKCTTRYSLVLLLTSLAYIAQVYGVID